MSILEWVTRKEIIVSGLDINPSTGNIHCHGYQRKGHPAREVMVIDGRVLCFKCLLVYGVDHPEAVQPPDKEDRP